MPQLTDTQIQTLKNKGLSDEKIKALAFSKGFTVPEKGFFEKVGGALIQSEKGFGQSIAAAIGSKFGAGKGLLEEANKNADRIRANVLQAINDKRDKGEDPTRLVNALRDLDNEVDFFDILNANTGGSLDKSTGQVLGEAAGVATDILGFGAIPGKLFKGAKAVKSAGGFFKGAKTGGKVGALSGAAFGGATSASFAAQEGGGVGEAIGAGFAGGVTGGALGGGIGAALGSVSGRIAGRGTRIANKEIDHALDFVSPKATTKIKEQAGRQGRVTAPGIFKPSKITPSRRDHDVADAVGGIVSRKRTIVQNIDAIDNKINEINTNLVEFIRRNPFSFNTNQLRTRLNSGKDDLRLVFTSDATAERTYEGVVDILVESLEKKTPLELFFARQRFDQIPAIKKLLESQALGENAKKEIVLQVRRQANNYVASLLPRGNRFIEELRRETLMFEALGNSVVKNASTIGKNKIQLLTQKYPILKAIIGGAAIGITGAAGVGVGGAIIGSSE